MTATSKLLTQDPYLIDLVDSVVAAVDLDRVTEIGRLREALQLFGASGLFDDELRLNGTRSTAIDQPCFCNAWL